MSLICLKDLCITYGKKESLIRAVNHLNLEIDRGDFVAITGKSGCGKTSLLNVIGGIKKPTSGYYFYEQKDVSHMSDSQAARFRNRNVGFVVQHFALIMDRTVSQNIEIPLLYRKKRMGNCKKEVQSVMELLHIEDKANRYPYELSGGQKQRVAIARALITKPEIIIADEPTGALDSENSNNIMNILENLNQQGITIILVTHDLEIAQRCKRIVYIKDGVVEKTIEK